MAHRPVRQVTDSRVLAAMSHPLRRRLIDVLKVHGPATVSGLAERTDQAIGNVSHHLKVLAASELVAEAPELARDRRERWWRLISPAVRWSSADFEADPSAQAVAQAAMSLDLDRRAGHVRSWYAAADAERAAWNDAAFSTERWLTLAPEELHELSRQVIELFDRWSTREVPDDGRSREPVFLFAYGVPAKP